MEVKVKLEGVFLCDIVETLHFINRPVTCYFYSYRYAPQASPQFNDHRRLHRSWNSPRKSWCRHHLKRTRQAMGIIVPLYAMTRTLFRGLAEKIKYDTTLYLKPALTLQYNPPLGVMGRGAAEVTGLSFICFVVIVCCLSANKIYFGLFFFCFINFLILSPLLNNSGTRLTDPLHTAQCPT